MKSNYSVNEVLPICKRGEELLIMCKSDLHRIGKGLGVLTIVVNLKQFSISAELIDLEKHLKFGDWTEIEAEEERAEALRAIIQSFKPKEVSDLIVKPLISKNRKETIG